MISFRSALLASAITLASAPAIAAATAPCSPEAQPSTNVYPISNGSAIFCATAYGWSDTWFSTSTPSGYSNALDVFSGEAAARITWDGMPGVGAQSGMAANSYGFLTPSLDMGTLNPQDIGTAWSIVNDLATSGNGATAKLALGGVTVGIGTVYTGSAGNGVVTETFTISNGTGGDVKGLTFGQYFNFHPNSSSGQYCGITSQAGGTITTISAGPACGSVGVVDGQGTISGTGTPVAWDLGTATSVLSDIVNGKNNNSNGPVGPDDTAGYLQWALGTLPGGGSTSFTVTLTDGAQPSSGSAGGGPTDVAEPGALGILCLGMTGLTLARRKRS